MRRHLPLQLVLVLAALAVGPPVRAQDAPAALKGLPLSDALRALQDAGLRIVFTSSIVTPGLRVESEPDGATPRTRLDALLAEHRLEARHGPGGIIQIVRARRPPQPESPPTGTIQGRVLHRLTSASLPRVAVALDGIEQASTTDAAGGFVVRRVAAGPHRVRASIPGIASDERTVQVRTVDVLRRRDGAPGRMARGCKAWRRGARSQRLRPLRLDARGGAYDLVGRSRDRRVRPPGRGPQPLAPGRMAAAAGMGAERLGWRVASGGAAGCP